ncbi:6-phosphofructo-2-kinase / fructose-2,6-biphosphatase 4 [Sarotherodon galilaeus]
MMEFVHVAVTVLGLLSLGHSAPVTSCDNLIQPREIHGNQLLGKWVLLGDSRSIPGSKMLVQMLMENTWAKITAASEANTFNSLQIQKKMDKCFTLKEKLTLVNNTLTILHPYRVSGVLLNTGCPDCLVIYSNMTVGRIEVRALKLLSRRVKVSAAELEEFTKQAECLNLQPPAIMDLEEGLCPDPTLAPETNFTDRTTDTISSDELSLLEELLSSESGVKTLFDMIQRSMAPSKQD